MNNSLKFLLVFVLTVYNYHLPAECLYCYVCNANYQACADPADLNAIRYSMEPCNGECIVYINPNTGMLTRSCSTYLGISGTDVQIINGVTYSFCNTDGCNAGGAPSLATTIATTTGAAATTTAAGVTTTAAGATTILPAVTTSALSGCSKGCENFGSQNADCSCSCLNKLYSGANCEIVNCDTTAQYPFCATDYTTQDCVQNTPYILCPLLCNPKCQVTKPTTTAAPTTTAPTTVASTTSQKCPGVICYSASILNEATCTCQCLSAATYGTYCQYIDCSVQDPAFCASVSCSATPSIPFQCTHLCGLCVGGVTTTAAPTTSAPTTAAPTTAAPTTTGQTTKAGPCVPIDCKFGGNFDLNSCTCKCPDNFYGVDCSTVSVSPDWTDPVECNDPALSCGGLTLDQDIAGMCPLKCLICGRKECQNGGLLKSDCTCQCLPAYTTSPLCDIKNCKDNAGCGTGKQFPPTSCIYTEIISMCPTMCKAKGC